LDAGLNAVESDLSIPLLRVLVAVELNPHLSVSELAEALGLPQQTASRYVAILRGTYQTADGASPFARQPLLAHQPSSTDLRRYELVLTQRGSERLGRILHEIFSKGGTE
jgi:DNA-binding MarR family transcriptional regulator